MKNVGGFIEIICYGVGRKEFEIKGGWKMWEYEGLGNLRFWYGWNEGKIREREKERERVGCKRWFWSLRYFI